MSANTKTGSSWKERILWGTWILSISLALLSMVVFLQGIFRDRRIGEPVLAIDLASSSDWQSTSFRVWGAGTYTLFMSSVNHDPQHIGAALAADFEVSIIDSAGRLFLQRMFPAGSTDHVLPRNYGDSRLGKFQLDDRPWRAWTLKARVLRPDARFRTARTEIKFWKDRYDPGMGGLMNYVMIIPALGFLILAFVIALALASKGFRMPMIATVVCGGAFLAFFLA